MGTGIGGKWAIYLRLSKHGPGIGRQRVVVTRWIDRQGGKVVREFCDKGLTAFQQFGAGVQPERSDFDAMCVFLAANPGHNAAAWHADRLARGVGDAERLLRATAKSGGVIGTERGGIYDPATAEGRNRFKQAALAAEGEVDHMTERIDEAKREAKEAGAWLGGPRPFGWDRVPRLNRDEPPGLRLNDGEAGLIRSGTLAVINGASLRSVTLAWNASGIKGSRGGTWANREVADVLRRARNAGLAEYDLDGHGLQVTGQGTWPAIVTEDQWRACKAILQDPKRRTAFTTQPRHLLSGIAVCGVCGTPVVGTVASGAGRRRQVTYRDRPKDGKGHVARTAEPLEAYVSEYVIAWVELHGQEALNPPAPDTAPMVTQLKAVEAELETLEEGAKAMAITAAQLLRWAAPLNEQATALREQIAAAAATRSPLRVFTEGEIRAAWPRADLDAKRALIRALMDITILPSPRGRPAGYQPGPLGYLRPETVRIEWKRGDG